MDTPEEAKPRKRPRKKRPRAQPELSPGAPPPAQDPQPSSRKGGLAALGVLSVVLGLGKILWTGAQSPSQGPDAAFSAAFQSPAFKCGLECRVFLAKPGPETEPDPTELGQCKQACQSAKAELPELNFFSYARTCRNECNVAYSEISAGSPAAGSPPPAGRAQWTSPYDCMGRCAVASARGDTFDAITGVTDSAVKTPVPASFH
jgi:hypothetical protein